MPDMISYSYAIEVGGNVEFSTKDTIEVDGYSKNEIDVPNDGSNKDLKDAFPLKGSNNDDPGDIKFLLIREVDDEYDGNLEYAFSTNGGNPEFRTLDHPLILPVGGAIGSAGIEEEDLTLKNTGNADRTVHVIVGRSTS